MDNEVLRGKLLEYKEVTNNLINSITNEKMEVIDGLFQRRGELITEINKLLLNRKEFKTISEELGLLEQDKTLKELVENKKKDIQVEIRNIQHQVNANKSYGSNSLRSISFINTRI